MEVKFKYEDIFSQCEQLSSFEARGKVDANGNSRYLDIHIGEVDRLLVDQYITQAVINLQEAFSRMIVSTIPNAGVVETTTEDGKTTTEEIPGFTWVMRDDSRWNGAKAFTKHTAEAIASYVLAQWLSDKLPERVQFYEGLFTSSLAMASKNLFTKQAPKKK